MIELSPWCFSILDWIRLRGLSKGVVILAAALEGAWEAGTIRFLYREFKGNSSKSDAQWRREKKK